MNFNTANSTFRQLMGNGLRYRVPSFQRDYSWSEDEWDDLWQDMVGLFSADGEPAHYMGYLVLQTSDSKQFDIIDGQQRLTTISLLILAVLAHLDDLIDDGFDAEHNDRRKEQLQNSYIGYVDPVSLVPRPKLELNRHNNQFYQTYLVPLETLPQRGLNASEHLLRKAFLWFKDRLRGYCGKSGDSGKQLAGFIDTLVDKLFFTVITVTDELNAFKVFETLNARGVRLSATDLLKNYLFSVISGEGTHETEIKSLEDRWERIVGLLEKESFPEFLRVFWNSRNKLVRKSDLFKTIRRNIQTKRQAFELLKDLDHSAALYAALRDPADNQWNQSEKSAIEQFLMFNVRQPLSVLMACFVRFQEDQRDAFTRIIRALAVISFRYNVICNLQTHDQERLYNEIACKVSGGELTQFQDVLAELRNVYPEDLSFKTAFGEKEFRTTHSRNRKVVRYILFEIERQSSGNEFDFESATYSLEHILPEHPSEDWETIEYSKQSHLVYRIGNITLLETGKNRDLANADYQTKCDAYRQSIFAMTQSLPENYDVWNEQKIESRQKHFASVASGIWRIEF